MYKNKQKSDFLKDLSLPQNYKVDGLIVFGGWKKEKQINFFIEVINELYPISTCTRLNDFLIDILEVQVNGKIIWFTVQYGGALLSEYIHLASIFGSKTNILIGSCGGLNLEIKTNDLIIPTFSFGDESTTRFYQTHISNNKHYSTEELSKIFENKLKADNNVFLGPVTTCQAMLAETWEMIEKWSAEGYYGVEMESSTVFAVSNHFNVKCTALLYVADNLIKQKTVLDVDFQNSSNLRNSMVKKLYSTAVEVIVESF